jgi:hypothetical protein
MSDTLSDSQVSELDDISDAHYPHSGDLDNGDLLRFVRAINTFSSSMLSVIEARLSSDGKRKRSVKGKAARTKR